MSDTIQADTPSRCEVHPRRMAAHRLGGLVRLMSGLLRVGARILSLALILCVTGYQAMIRPFLVGSCKFVPSCSEYFIQSVRRHGPVRGASLGLRRLGRCRPGVAGGIDPVPDHF